MIDWTTVSSLAAEHGDSFYLVDLDTVTSNVEQLRTALCARYPNSRVAYSFKTNYLPRICRTALDAGAWAQVDSDMEYGLARQLGVPGPHVVFNGPARSAEVLVDAVTRGALVNLDSRRDLRLLEEHLPPAREPWPVGLRCSFPVGGAPPSRFGVDVSSPDFTTVLGAIRSSRRVRLVGLHSHFGLRSLAHIAERTSRTIALARDILGGAAAYIDVGGSLYGGVPAGPSIRGDEDFPSVDAYAAEIGGQMAAAFGTGARTPLLVIEPGTAVVATAVSYVTRVATVKTVSGAPVVGVHGTVLHISPNLRRHDWPVHVVRAPDSMSDPPDAADGPSATVVGSTMLEEDLLRADLRTTVAEGDFLVFDRVGAYSLSMAPTFGQPPPAVLGRQHPQAEWEQLRPRAAGATITGDQERLPHRRRPSEASA